MSDLANEVLVIGAAGYVGQALLRRLLKSERKVAVICRPHSAFLFERYGPQVRVIGGEGTCEDRFSDVINLAYPTGYPVHRRNRENRALADQVASRTERGGRVIHVSSHAVFGFHLDQPVVAGPMPMRRDYEYVESKLWLENRLARLAGELQVDIVRLGNVWGPASPNWAVGLTERLRAGQPVRVNGLAGFSNATDVANVADYLVWLLENRRQAGHCQYHHLAEFSARRWSDYLDYLARELKLPMKSIPGSSRPRPRGLGIELRAALRGLAGSPLQMLQSLRSEQLAGSYLRSGIAALPDTMGAAVKQLRNRGQLTASAPMDVIDQLILEMITLEREFVSQTDPGWTPVCGWDESLTRVGDWLRSAGYVHS